MNNNKTKINYNFEEKKKITNNVNDIKNIHVDNLRNYLSEKNHSIIKLNSDNILFDNSNNDTKSISNNKNILNENLFTKTYENNKIILSKNFTKNKNMINYYFLKRGLTNMTDNNNQTIKNNTNKFDSNTLILNIIFLIIKLFIAIFFIFDNKDNENFSQKYPMIIKFVYLFSSLSINIQMLTIKNIMEILEYKLVYSFIIPHTHSFFICYFIFKINSDIPIHCLSIIFSILLIYHFNIGYNWSTNKYGLIIFLIILPYITTLYIIEKNNKKVNISISFNKNIHKGLEDFKENLCFGVFEIKKDLFFDCNLKFIENINYLMREYNLDFTEINEIYLLKILFCNLDYKMNFIKGSDEKKISDIILKINSKLDVFYSKSLYLNSHSNMNSSKKKENIENFEFKIINKNSNEIKFEKKSIKDMENDLAQISDILFENIISHKFIKFAEKKYVGKYFEFYIRNNKYSQAIEIIVQEKKNDVRDASKVFEEEKNNYCQGQEYTNIKNNNLRLRQSITNIDLKREKKNSLIIDETNINEKIRFKKTNLKKKYLPIKKNINLNDISNGIINEGMSNGINLISDTNFDIENIPLSSNRKKIEENNIILDNNNFLNLQNSNSQDKFSSSYEREFKNNGLNNHKNKNKIKLEEEKFISEFCLNEFIKGILNKFCHEFRNPLMNIIQLVNEIKRNVKNSDQKNLKEILQVKYLTKSLSFLISDFEILNYLDFKKIDLRMLLKNKKVFGESFIFGKNDESIRKINSLNDKEYNKFENISKKKIIINEKEIKDISKKLKNMHNTLERNKNISDNVNFSKSKKFEAKKYISNINDCITYEEKELLKKKNYNHEDKQNENIINDKNLCEININKSKEEKELTINENSKLNITAIKKIIKSCFKIFQTKIDLSEKEIHLKYFISKDISNDISIKIDANRFSQLLICLLSNSLKFTNQGKICLKIKKDEKHLKISIKDSGIGIADNLNFNGEVPLISNMSECLTNIKLGFYIIKSILNKLSGFYQIKKRKNRGSTVKIFVPYISYIIKNTNYNIIDVDEDVSKKIEFINNNQRNIKEKNIEEEEKIFNNIIPNYDEDLILKKSKKLTAIEKINTILKVTNLKNLEKEPKLTKKKIKRTNILDKKKLSIKNYLESKINYETDHFKKKKSKKSKELVKKSKFSSEKVTKYTYDKKLKKNKIFEEKNNKKFEEKDDCKDKSEFFTSLNTQLKNGDVNYMIEESSRNYEINEYKDSSDFINSKDSYLETDKMTIINPAISFGIDYTLLKDFKIYDEDLDEEENPYFKKLLGSKYLDSSEKKVIRFASSNNLIFNKRFFNNNNFIEKNKNDMSKNKEDSDINISDYNINLKNKIKPKDTDEAFKYNYSIFLNYNKLDNNLLKEDNSNTFSINESVMTNSLSNTNNNEIIKIMVVDDEKLIRKSTMNVLNSYFSKCEKNINIEECSDGVECLFKIYESLKTGEKYEWILIDQTMNFLNGNTTAKIIKDLIKDNILYPIDITLVTSYEISSLSREFLSVFDRIFSKPISRNVLKNIFENK